MISALELNAINLKTFHVSLFIEEITKVKTLALKVDAIDLLSTFC